MKRSLTLTGITVNAMALIAPGAFLWTTFASQSALNAGTKSTAGEMWTGLLFSLVLALLTAYSYAQLAKIYPDAGAGSSYYFAESAFLDKESPKHQGYARFAKLSVGWISHLYYWIYPGIMVAFTATLFGYIYQTVAHHQLSFLPLAAVAVVFAMISGYIAYRGVSGSTMAAIAVNVIQITTLVIISILFIVWRVGHAHAAPLVAGLQGAYEHPSALHVIIPHSFINLLYQSTIAILLLVGFESVTALGAEALRPEKDIQKGVLLSLLIQGGICYLFEYFAANFAIGNATVATAATAASGSTAAAPAAGGYAAAAASNAPMADMLKTIGDKMLGNTGTTIGLIVAFTVMLALIGTTLACLNTGVRVTYAMARDKEMPGVLSLLHGKYATPHGGIWVLTAVSAVLGIYGVKSVNNLTQITLASNTGTFIVYGLTCIVALVAFASRHDRHLIKHKVIPAVGALMNIAELLGVIYIAVKAGGASSKNAYIALGVVVVWSILGIVWAAFNPNKQHARELQSGRKGPTVVAAAQPVKDAEDTADVTA